MYIAIYRCISNVLKPILLTGIADADPYARKAGRQLYWILKYKQNTTTYTTTITTSNSINNSTMLYSMMESIFIDSIEPLHQKHINSEYMTMTPDLTLLLNLSSGGTVPSSSLLLTLPTSSTTDTTDLTTTLMTAAKSDSSIGSVGGKSGSGTALKPNSSSGPRRPSLRNTTVLSDTATTQGLNTTTNSNTVTHATMTDIATTTMSNTSTIITSSMLPPRAPALSGAVRLIPDRTVSAHTSSAINSSISGISSNSGGGSSMVVSSRRMTLSAPVRMPVRPPTAPITLPLPAHTHTPAAASIDMESVPLTNNTTNTATTIPMTTTTSEVENRSVPLAVPVPFDVITIPDLNLSVNCTRGIDGDGETKSTSVAAGPLSSTNARLVPLIYTCYTLYSTYMLFNNNIYLYIYTLVLYIVVGSERVGFHFLLLLTRPCPYRPPLVLLPLAY